MSGWGIARANMIRQHFPGQAGQLAVIYGNTGVEYPECVRFAREIAEGKERAHG